MEGLRRRKYAYSKKRRFDPGALVISSLALLGVFYGVSHAGDQSFLFDLRSIVIVFGGTFATLLFQFDLSTAFASLRILGKSMIGPPDRQVLKIMRQLDDAIINQMRLSELREGVEINGDLLNDAVYMHHQGLLIEEIEGFITARVRNEFLDRETAVAVLNRAALISPALGLLGTVIGLVGVLRSLSDPSQIGPHMSLALMTTAYGAGMGSLVFTPLAGRLQHHNLLYLDSHQQFLAKMNLLIKREERMMDGDRGKEGAA